MSVPSCPPGPWSTSAKTVWGTAWSQCTPFTAVSFGQKINGQTSGAIINSLTFWVNGEGQGWQGNICGITMGMTDGTTTSVGYNSSAGNGIVAGTKFNLGVGEKISSFIVCLGPNTYNNINQVGWSGVSISTNKGHSLIAGSYQSPDPSQGYSLVNVDVGSGFLAGFYGTYATPLGNFGQVINQFGVLFLAQLSNIDVGVTSYQPNPTNTNDDLNVVALSSVTYSDPGPWKFSGSIVRTASSSYTSETTETFGGSATITVEGSLFGIGGSASGTMEWTSTQATGMSAEVSQAISLEWEISGDLPANEQVICTARVSQGVLNLTYDSTVTFNFVDTTIAPVVIPEGGSYSNVAFSVVTVNRDQSSTNGDTKAVDAA